MYWSLKNEVLIELRDLLVDKLQYEKTMSYLRSKRVFDRRDQEDIEAERGPTRRKEKFLDILSDKGPTAFDHFCHAIGKKCTGQQHLLDIILTTFDRKKQERILKEPPPANLHRSISNPSEDSKLVVMVTGVTDMDNLPSPGDPGAPMPPDEVDNATGQHRPQTQRANSTPVTPPPSYSSDMPPPYTE